jgi:mono/diheme cytochrome c family protein
VGILAVLLGFALTWRPAIAPIAANAAANKSPANTDRKTIDQGAELASIGNCSDCHTSENAASYAGGRPIPTPCWR